MAKVVVDCPGSDHRIDGMHIADALIYAISIALDLAAVGALANADALVRRGNPHSAHTGSVACLHSAQQNAGYPRIGTPGARHHLLTDYKLVKPFALTLFTPRIFSANSMARARSAPLLTLPLRTTTPSLVSTVMSELSTLLENT